MPKILYRALYHLFLDNYRQELASIQSSLQIINWQLRKEMYHMKQIILCAIIVLISASSIIAQRGQNLILVSYNQKYFLNKANLEQNGIAPDPMSTRNTFEPAASIAFQRSTRYNLILEAGLEYGVQEHDIALNYDFSDFDPEAKAFLKGYKYGWYIGSTSRYISLHFMGGYRYNLPSSDWAIVGKLGLSRYAYRGGYTFIGGDAYIFYRTDDSSENRAVAYSGQTAYLGSTEAKGSWYQFRNPINNYEVYIGMERGLDNKFIRRIDAGLQYSHSWGSGYSQFVQIGSVTHWNDTKANFDWYYNRNVSIALKVGLGLW